MLWLTPFGYAQSVDDERIPLTNSRSVDAVHTGGHCAHSIQYM